MVVKCNCELYKILSNHLYLFEVDSDKPSYIAFTKSGCIVGEVAKRKTTANP